MKDLFKTFVTLIVIGMLAVVVYFVWDLTHERTPIEKLAEIIHAEDSREISEKLRLYLQDPEASVRARAALAVGRIGGPESGALLVDAIGDVSPDVAISAAFALGLTDHKELAGRLLDQAYDMPASIGAAIVEAAGRLVDSSMTAEIDLIVDFLSHPSPDVREVACMALFRANAKSKMSDLIDALEQEQDELVIRSGLYCLSRLRVQEGEPIFIDNLADPDPFARTLAVRGLGRCESKDAARFLTIALNDGDNGVVADVITALARKNDSETTKLLAAKFRRMTDEKLRIHLLDAMRHQENDLVVDAMDELFIPNQSSFLIGAAIKYLATFIHDRAVVRIDSLVAAGDPVVRASCAEAYGLMDRSGISNRVVTLFSDPSPRVRVAAFNTLVAIDSTGADYYIKLALSDSDFVVSSSAINQIGEWKLTDYLPTMNDMMDAGESPAIDVRWALTEAAGEFLGENPTDSLAMALLLKGALDPEYAVRKVAARVYRDVLNENRDNIIRYPITRYSVGDIKDFLTDYVDPPVVVMSTNKGDILIQLDPESAPLAVMNFLELVEDEFYDGIVYHRVIPNFVAQAGDPRGDGWGGPDHFLRCEYSSRTYDRGVMGMATSGKDTGGSQFFFTLSPQPHLDGRYTIFGQVFSGMEIVDQLVQGDVIDHITIDQEDLLSSSRVK